MPIERKVIDFKLTCNKCKEVKLCSDFHARKDTKAGYNSWCKKCVRETNKNRHPILLDDDPIIMNGKRVCNICEKEKSLTAFGLDKESKFGRSYKCLTCKVYKESRRQSEYLYGVTFEEKQKMLTAQMGLCANRSCGKEIKFDTVIRAEMAVLDHCHTTGKVRGILCNRCNLVVGHVEKKNKLKSKHMLFGLTEYLQKHT
jgi:hypothetical protein